MHKKETINPSSANRFRTPTVSYQVRIRIVGQREVQFMKVDKLKFAGVRINGVWNELQCNYKVLIVFIYSVVPFFLDLSTDP